MDVTTSDVGLSISTNPKLTVDAIAPRPAPVVVDAVAPASPTSGGGGFLSRPHILEATEACFAQVGYDGTTIRAIAGRLGCAVGSIYRYFDDKNALLLSCASRVIEPVARQIDEKTVTIEQSIGHYVRQARAHAEMYSLLMWLTERTGGVSGGVIQKVIDGWAALLGDTEAAGRAWATVHGLILLGSTEEQIVAAALSRSAARVARPAAPAASASIVVEQTPVPAEDVTLL